MGSSRRFEPTRECAPGDYSSARPGAFSSSSKKGVQNTGFGGTTARETAFEAAARRAASSESAQLSYDTSSMGAFAKAADASSRSAAFASKSSQRTAVAVPEGPGAQSYNTASVASLASGVNKSFNKSHQAGT